MGSLKLSLNRAKMRMHRSHDTDKFAIAATPKKLTKPTEFPVFILAVENKLSTMVGEQGVALSYIARINDEPDRETDFEGDFDAEAIACCPVTGVKFAVDARTVHQFIQSLTTGESSESWLKSIRIKRNGRLDIKALRSHYTGEASLGILRADAEKLRDTMVYKSERTMTFDKFLTNMEKMFHGFVQGNEALTESQKVRLIIQKVQHPELQAFMKATKIASNQENKKGVVLPDSKVGYTFIADSICEEVSQLQEYTAPGRNASGIETSKYGKPGPESGIHGTDGNIHTGFYKNFRALSSEQKSAVMDERKRLNIVPPPKTGGKRGGGGSGNGGGGGGRNVGSVKQANKKMKLMKKEIAALQATAKSPDKKKGEVVEQEATVPDNAGGSFGGRASKKD